jgi:hypothetical protein
MGCLGTDENGNGDLDQAGIDGVAGEDDSTESRPGTGSDSPTDGDSADVALAFDPVGLFDDKYFDGHVWQGKPTPILPPGKWDWNATNNDLANYKNFQNAIGALVTLQDENGEHCGWKLQAKTPAAVDFAGPAAYFEGSSGRDIVNLGPQGKIHSMSGSLSAGPDVLVFNKSYSLDFSTSAATGSASHDDDIVVAGCDANATAAFDIATTSIHTGSGADVLFVRDAERSAFDAGNLGGLTGALDPEDGDDVTILRGNMLDFRTVGGKGNDTVVWYVDEVNQESAWLGPNFFGGGGEGQALWGDSGTDRLVLVIPASTTVISGGATQPGQLLVRTLANYPSSAQWDAPTQGDPRAKYCVTCGVGPSGRKTVTLEYRSADGAIHTGYFWVTAFEELQIGVGPGARVYTINDVAGTVALNDALPAFEPPALDPSYCAAP